MAFFPAWNAKAIINAVQQAGLTAVQLHGTYDPTLVHALRSGLAPGVALIQVVHWPVAPKEDEALTVSERLKAIHETETIDSVLVDSKVGSTTGGTGIPFDWVAAKRLFVSHPELILAGGLKPQSIREAVDILRPWGVDVASGVEDVAGKKDPEKLERFIAEAKRL